MTPDIENVTFARESERLIENVDCDSENRVTNNWIVTVRFYTYLHYVEQRLQEYDYNSRSHDNRKENIRNCKNIDNKARKLYRRLEDMSRDARYECVEMTEEDVEKSLSTLREGKRVLNFHAGGGDHKYTT